jgi:hypothetical protein
MKSKGYRNFARDLSNPAEQVIRIFCNIGTLPNFRAKFDAAAEFASSAGCIASLGNRRLS